MRVLSPSFSVLAAAYLTVSSFFAFTFAHALHAHSIAGTPPAPRVLGLATSKPRYLVLMVLDGARPDYLGLTSLPHLDALRESGTQFTNAFDGILESETPAGHATIATGSRPNRSGILGFDWMNDSGRYSVFAPEQMGALVQILSDAHAPTIAALYKQRYPGARVVAISGHKYYAAAPLGGPAADAILYYNGDAQGRYVPVAVPGHVPPASVLNDPGLISPTNHLPDGAENHLATKLALATVAKMQPRVLLINYPEFDWPLGHVDGGSLDPDKVTTDMQAFDADLGRIEDAYRKAGILDQTLFAITADHGMMPITRFIPSSVISNAVSRAGTSAPNIASSSAAYVWLADGTRSQTVAENIAAAHDPGIQSTYYLTSFNGVRRYVLADASALAPEQDAANQYLLGALMNGHEPDVVSFGREGASFSDPKSNWKADHGGNSWQAQHIPLILAGPGIRSGVVSDSPAGLQDVAPTVLTDMGVEPAGMDGAALTDALMQSASAAERARAADVARIAPVVTALSEADSSTTAG